MPAEMALVKHPKLFRHRNRCIDVYMMPLRCSDIMHRLSDPQTRVLRKECFELRSHNLNEQFDVCSDCEKPHFVMVSHNGLKRIFNTVSFLVLVGIGQRL